MIETGRHLLIAGVGKAGTTSLFDALDQHPDIGGSRPKELRHFMPVTRGREPEGLATLQRDHFGHAPEKAWSLIGATEYVFGGPRMVEAIAASLTRPKVLVILREPVARFWSHYRWAQQMGWVGADVDVAQFLERCRSITTPQDLRAAPDLGPRRALAFGCYADYLPEWFDGLGADFRVTFLEQLNGQPRVTLAGLFRWLGVTEDLAIEEQRRNATYQPRSRTMAAAVRSVGRRVPGLSPRLKDPLSRLYRRLNAAPDSRRLPDDVREQLRQFYRPTNAALAELLGRHGLTDLPAWVAA